MAHKYIFSGIIGGFGGSAANLDVINDISLDALVGSCSFNGVSGDLLSVAFKQLKSLISDFPEMCHVVFDHDIYNYVFVNEVVSLYYRLPQYLSVSRYTRKTPSWTINPDIGSGDFGRFFKSVSSSGYVFRDPVSFPLFRKALDSPGARIKLSSNSSFAFLMGKLSESNALCSQWQAVIERSGNFISSKQDRPISKESLSSLYNTYRSFDYGKYADMLDMVNRLVEGVPTA